MVLQCLVPGAQADRLIILLTQFIVLKTGHSKQKRKVYLATLFELHFPPFDSITWLEDVGVLQSIFALGLQKCSSNFSLRHDPCIG